MNRLNAEPKRPIRPMSVLFFGLFVLLAGSQISCNRESKPMAPNFDKNRSNAAVDQFLNTVRDNGLRSLAEVIDPKERPALAELEQLLSQQQKDQLPNAAKAVFDYRRDSDAQPVSGTASQERVISVNIRRCSGQGTFTFRVDQQGKVLCLNEKTESLLTSNDGVSELIEGLPREILEFGRLLGDAQTLRHVRLANGDHDFAVIFGLAGNVDRIEKVIVEPLDRNESNNQAVFHIVVLEKQIPAVARLAEGGVAVDQLLRLGDKSPSEFFIERKASFAGPP